jgi:Holliday junction resolvase RusA-like endonuclease
VPRYEVAPTAKVRQTQSDRWKKRPCVMRYREFADRLRELGCQLKDNDAVCFYIEMPASWSKYKKSQMEGKQHRQRPDLDNLVGGLMDAIMPDSDSHISMLSSIRPYAVASPDGFLSGRPSP